MRALGEWRRRLAVLFRRGRFERELEEEMLFHLQLAEEEHRAAGSSEQEAREAARRAFGRTLNLREDSRAAWGWTAIDTLGRDLRHAVRSMGRAPGFTVATLLTLALGIGAATGIFSVTYALLFRPLAVEQPSGLRFLTHDTPRGDVARFSYIAYQELRARTRTLSAAAAMHNPGPGLMSLPGASPENLQREWSTPEYFATLGVRPVAGRLFTAEEDASGARVVLIGEALWERLFARRADVVGSVLLENGRPYTVVGVLPARFTGIAPDRRVDVWFPSSRCIARCMQDPGCETFKILVRVKAEVPETRAADELDGLFGQHRSAWAGQLAAARSGGQGDSRLRLAYAGAGESVLGLQYRRPLFALLALVGLLLLMMCANIANLLLARTLAQERELGTRLALGAGTARLVSQCLTESLILALAGGSLGVWLAIALSRGLVSRVDVPLDVTPDIRVLAFALAASLVSALLFGLAPATSAARARVSVLLRRAGGVGRGRLTLGAPLVVAQVAISVVLLGGAGLFVRSFSALASERPGFARESLLTASLITPNGYHPSADPAIWRLLAKIRTEPGVLAASVGSPVPPGGGPMQRANVPGYEAASPADTEVAVTEVSDGYFETVGVPLLRGRLLQENDRGRSPAISVVNQAFAARFFGASNPIGREVALGSAGGDGAQGLGLTRIVGVVADARLRHPRDQVVPTIFPMIGRVWVSSLVVRTETPPEFLVAALPAYVRRAEPGLRVASAGTVASETNKLLTRERLLAELSGFFALTALVLAALGIYGLVAHQVTRRTKELGIRIALGASPGAVGSMVLRQTIAMVTVGLAVGVVTSLAVGRLARSLLYAVQPADPATLALSVLTFALVAGIAGLLPARRASRIPPVEAVRCE